MKRLWVVETKNKNGKWEISYKLGDFSATSKRYAKLLMVQDHQDFFDGKFRVTEYVPKGDVCER